MTSSSKITDLFDNDTRLAILLILLIYESLNLRQIAKVLGMTEPSAHVHVKELLKQKMIELDPQMVDKRGKYYKVTATFRKIIENDEMTKVISSLEKGTEEYYRIISRTFRTVALLSQRMGLYASDFMAEKASALNKEIEEKPEEDAFSITGNLSFINISNNQDYEDIKKAYNEFQEKLDKIGERNIDIPQNELFENIMFTSMIIPMKRMDPRKSE